ncbi:MAG: ATP-binding cassette domain-containing protein [Bifidobacteriaceae bacterium]|nr:ATP-binding cassette domain-containing protein [Bifidobacteriaceae bacterium]
MPSVSLSSVLVLAPDAVPILSGIDLALGPGRHGLTGPNGGGKSTLLRVIAGEAPVAAGHRVVRGEVGYLPQRLAAAPDAAVAELLGVAGPLAALRRIEAGGLDPADFDAVGADWDLEDRIAAQVGRLGLAGIGLDRRVGSLSGGEAVALAFAGLLLRRPGVLLLDEPTNNLDARWREALMDGIGGFGGVLLAVTHDVGLLDRMDRIGELRGGELAWYPVPFAAFEEAKRVARESAERRVTQAKAQVKSQRRDLQESQTKQARRDAQGRAQAGSMPKILANAMKRKAERTAARNKGIHEARLGEAQEELAEAKDGLERRIRFRLELPETQVPAGRMVLELDHVRPAHTDLDVSLLVKGPERIGITGPNGTGKTSLLRCALGEAKPEAGRVKLYVPARALPQDLALLDDSLTVLQNMELPPTKKPMGAPSTEMAEGGAGPDSLTRANEPVARQGDASAFVGARTPAELRERLARLGFRGDKVHQAAGTLSGGERWRATLAALLLRGEPPQLLVLDEPTNNLDLDSQSFLLEALAAYRGALLVVSHDEAFLSAINLTGRLRLP